MPKKRLDLQIQELDLGRRVIYVSTYPPRECGIATYTRELIKAINTLNPLYPADVAAIEDLSSGVGRRYPWEVKYKISQPDLKSWLEAADYINESSAEVVNLQHEFGIYGGHGGEYIIPFMQRIKKPKVVTLHTVLPDDNNTYSELTKKMVQLSDAAVVMIEAAAKRLINIHQVDPTKVVVIPHGVPDIPFGGVTSAKKKLGLGQALTITSFGLINSGKKLEKVIEALPLIRRHFSNITFLVVGETHPVVKRKEGEVYRDGLKKLAEELGVDKNVIFVDHYLQLSEIIDYLRATDVFVTPYEDVNQISSGTLAYAISAGKACVSTPYLYAKESLGNDRGVLVKSNSPEALADAINKIFTDEDYRCKLARRAYAYGRKMIWPRVGLKYLELFKLVSRPNDSGQA